MLENWEESWEMCKYDNMTMMMIPEGEEEARKQLW